MNETTNLGELTLTRIYEAPRDLVFRCMIDPDHLTHFWGPIGVSTPRDGIVVDPTPGGRFETRMVSDDDGSEFTMRAVFVEVDAPERIVWTEPEVEGGMTTSITFVDLGNDRTEVVSHQTNIPEMFRTPEAQAGLESSFDKFAAYLSTLSA